MIIASNDYPSNVPGKKTASHGGTARFARDLSSTCIKQGFSWLGIISERKDKEIQKNTFLRAHNHKRFWKHSFPKSHFYQITWAKKKRSPKIILKEEVESIKKIFQMEKPDMLFLNGFSMHNWILLRAAFEMQIPIVNQHAGILKKEVHIYKDYFSPAGRRILYGMESDITKLSTHEIFLNDFSRREYERTVTHVSATKRSIIPLPIPIRMCRNVKQKKISEIKHIGMVARWDRIKNYPAFLDIAREALAQKKPWTFHVVTHIPDTKINKEFKTEFKDSITVHALMDSKQLSKFYHDMDIMLLPSHFDVSPHVVLEAACQNTGTIISKNVGWVDIYKETGNKKWIVNFQDVETVISNIEQHFNEMLNQKFLTYIKKAHDPKRVYKTYIALFNRLANESKSI